MVHIVCKSTIEAKSPQRYGLFAMVGISQRICIACLAFERTKNLTDKAKAVSELSAYCMPSETHIIEQGSFINC